MNFSADTALIIVTSIALVFLIVFVLCLLMLVRRKHALELAEQKLADVSEQLQQTGEQLADIQNQYSEYRQIAQSREHELSSKAQITEMRAQEQLKHHEQLNQEILKSREQLQKDFELLSNKVFEQSRQKFESESKKTLDSTLDPLKKEIESFRKRVDETHQEDLKDRNRLQGQIQELHKQTQQIGQDAIQLAVALKGESKSQGNWGEMVLERLLEESGLEKGREYEVQASFRDQEGKLKQPDVIVHLPENKDIVIDAKVSLVAYERFFHAETDVDKELALKDHMQSLRTHFSGLSGKSYESLENLNSLDFVFMFVPVEPAYLLALQKDPSLFQQAYDKGVVMVSPTTLMVTLKTVASIWRYEKQNRNAQEIADSAGGLYDQFMLLIESLDDLGKKIDSAQKSYAVQAETSVWQIEKDGNKLFLGGTLHLLTRADFPLPEEFDQAYSASDIIYLETDIGAMNSPEFMAKSMAAMTYSDGRTLQSVLEPDTYRQLSQYLAGKGMPISMLNGFTAGGVSLTITLLELQSLGYTDVGVDRHYYSKAWSDKKELGFFETVDEQLSFIAALGEGIEDEVVSYTLADMARLSELFDAMKTQWRTGDVDTLFSTMIVDLKNQFPDVYESLFLRRNHAWMPDIEGMLQTEETEFVLVGAGHMVGPDGLLQQLSDSGYMVTQL
eukprot:g4397.t1